MNDIIYYNVHHSYCVCICLFWTKKNKQNTFYLCWPFVFGPFIQCRLHTKLTKHKRHDGRVLLPITPFTRAERIKKLTQLKHIHTHAWERRRAQFRISFLH